MAAEIVLPLQRLAELGQSVWIDYLSRDLLESGGLARLVRDDAVVGVDYGEVVETLEAEGVEKFAHALSQLFAELDAKRQVLLARTGRPR